MQNKSGPKHLEQEVSLALQHFVFPSNDLTCPLVLTTGALVGAYTSYTQKHITVNVVEEDQLAEDKNTLDTTPSTKATYLRKPLMVRSAKPALVQYCVVMREGTHDKTSKVSAAIEQIIAEKSKALMRDADRHCIHEGHSPFERHAEPLLYEYFPEAVKDEIAEAVRQLDDVILVDRSTHDILFWTMSGGNHD